MTCRRGCCESQRVHWLSISIAPAAMPTRSGPRYSDTTNLEKRWEADLPAYQRLVKGGVQPDSVDGAAELEKQVDAIDGQVVNAD